MPFSLFATTTCNDKKTISWASGFPATFAPISQDTCILVGTSGYSLANKNNITFDSSDSYSYGITIQKNPSSTFTQFHNLAQINTLNANLTIDMPDVDFYLDGGSFTSKEGLILNGRDFYANNGIFELNSFDTFNFGDFINNGGLSIEGTSNLTINLTGKFSNDSALNLTGKDENPLSVSIKGGDVYNGRDRASAQNYFSGTINLSKSTMLTIEKDLISEGISDTNRSKILINGGYLTVNGTLENNKYSDIIVSGGGSMSATNIINNGNITLQASPSNLGFSILDSNITNKAGSEMHLTGGHIGDTGNFISEAGSKLYLSGTDYTSTGLYANINANTINIKGALVYFSKGSAFANTPYNFLTASTSLAYDASLLGIQDVLSDDGSINDFYEAVVETSSDSNKSLKVTFKPKQPNISNQSEKTIIDMFSKENPIPGFDIKNLSMKQIRKISKNINDGFKYYAHHKDTPLHNAFEIIKTNIFGRMIGGESHPSVAKHSNLLLPYYKLQHYATNDNQVIATDVVKMLAANTKAQKQNNVYINVLGAFETFSQGYGYNYGLSIGYDRNFDDKALIGGYFSYVGGKLDFDGILSTQTQSFQLGVYGRFYTSIFETDLILNQGYGINKSTKNIAITSDIYTTHSKYNTQMFDILLQSGPKFIFGKNSIKPYIGLNMSFYTGMDTDEDTEVFASSYSFKNSVYLSENIGIEYKRIFQNGYFFIRPAYEANILSNATETKIVFLNNTIQIAAAPKEMFGSVLVGGEMMLKDSLFLNLNASARTSNQKTFIATGMASLKYAF